MSPKKKGARNRPSAGPREAAGTRPRQAGGAARQAGNGRHNPAPAAALPSIYTPGGSAFRHSVERVSAPALLVLTKPGPEGSRKPRPAIMLAPLVLLLLGFFLPFVFGMVALAIFLVFTTWLAYLSWPRTDARARLIRVVMFVLVIGLIVIRVSRR